MKKNVIKIFIIIIMLLISVDVKARPVVQDDPNVRTPKPTTNATPSPTASSSCSNSNMKSQSTCISEARGKCSNGYTGCKTKNSKGCYSYVCNQCDSIDNCSKMSSSSCTCQTCKAGYIPWRDGSYCVQCNDDTDYWANGKCNSCPEGKVTNSNFTGCELPKITSVSAAHKNVYLAQGEAAPRVFLLATYNKSPLNDNVVWTAIGGGINGKSTSNAYTATIEGGVGTYNRDVKAAPAGNPSGSASTTINYKRFQCAWSERSCGANECAYKTSQPSYGSAIWNDGCNFFSGGSKIDGGYKYSTFHSRCCGSPPPSNVGGCWGNEPYIGLATKVTWLVANKASGDYKYRYTDIKDAESCKVMATGKICTSKDSVSKPVTKTANKCEINDNALLFTVTTAQNICSSDNVNYYKINCSRDVTTKFDFQNDGKTNTSNELLRGLGFEFGIKIVTDINCKATFDPDGKNAWIDSYNKVMAKLKTIKARNSTSFTTTAYDAYKKNNDKEFDNFFKKLQEIDKKDFTKKTQSYMYELHRLARDLEDIVNAYNNFNTEKEYKEGATLKLDYKIGDNNKKTFTYNFDSSTSSTKPTKTVSKTHSNIHSAASWLKSPQDYTSKYTMTTSLYPKMTYVDKNNGTIYTEKKANTIPAGNKIYIDDNAYIDPKTNSQKISPIKITVTGLGGNESTVENNKCSLVVKSSDMKYRPISLTNPFINSSWKKGENWVNSEYDFTKAIHATTWNEATLYDIGLTAKQLNSLRENTYKYLNSGYAPYLGLCNLLSQTEINNNETLRTICNVIK